MTTPAPRAGAAYMAAGPEPDGLPEARAALRAFGWRLRRAAMLRRFKWAVGWVWATCLPLPSRMDCRDWRGPHVRWLLNGSEPPYAFAVDCRGWIDVHASDSRGRIIHDGRETMKKRLTGRVRIVRAPFINEHPTLPPASPGT